MELFRRNTSVSIDLKERKLEECVYYPKCNNEWSQEFYLKETFNPNHLQIAKKSSKVYTNGLHDFVYNEEQQQLVIESKCKKSAFLIYLYLLMPAVALIGAEENQLKIVCLAIAMFIFITLILFFGIKSESKKIELNFMQQVYYFNRHNKRAFKGENKEKP